MNNIKSRKLDYLGKISTAIVSGLIYAVALNVFLINAKSYSVGLTGIVQLIKQVLGLVDFNISLSVLLALCNIPLLIFGYIKFGFKYIVFSLLTLGTSILFLTIIPVTLVIDNKLTNTICGAVGLGISEGICFNNGFTTGGTDILLSYLQVKYGINIGVANNFINGTILLITACFFGFSQVIYSAIGMFICNYLMDRIYTYQNDASVIIFTKHAEKLKKLLSNGSHGATLVDGKGIYTNKDTSLIVTLVQKNQVKILISLIKEHDPEAFITVSDAKVVGRYSRTTQVIKHT